MMRRLAARISFELVCRRASELGWELKIEGEKVVLYKRDSLIVRWQKADQLWVFLNKDAEWQGELNVEIVE